jgi:hypothetical protein
MTEAIFHLKQGTFTQLYADTLFLFYIIMAGAQPRQDRRQQDESGNRKFTNLQLAELSRYRKTSDQSAETLLPEAR